VNIYGTSSKPGDLQKLRTFFYENARKRSQVFQHANQSTECGDMELATTHTVRFSAMHSATTRVLQLYPAVLTALKDVCKRPEDFDAAVRAESKGLLTRFSDFETLITLMVFKEIFDIVVPLNTFLQTSGLDLALCVAEADIAEAKLQTLRDSRSNNIIRDAKVTAETLEIASQFKEKRLHKKKRLFDKVEGADKRTSDPNE